MLAEHTPPPRSFPPRRAPLFLAGAAPSPSRRAGGALPSAFSRPRCPSPQISAHALSGFTFFAYFFLISLLGVALVWV